jgi:serine/threonine-protein kinase RsbW
VRSTQAELDLAFPPKPEYVGTARHTVAALAHLRGVSDDSVQDVKLAVSEACTNAATINARAEGKVEDVRVRVYIEGSSFVIDVLDRGPTIDSTLADRPARYDSQEFTFEKGLSLPLIQGLVDRLEILPREGGGTVIRMQVPVSVDNA